MEMNILDVHILLEIKKSEEYNYRIFKSSDSEVGNLYQVLIESCWFGSIKRNGSQIVDKIWSTSLIVAVLVKVFASYTIQNLVGWEQKSNVYFQFSGDVKETITSAEINEETDVFIVLLK